MINVPEAGKLLIKIRKLFRNIKKRAMFVTKQLYQRCGADHFSSADALGKSWHDNVQLKSNQRDYYLIKSLALVVNQKSVIEI